MYLKIKSIKDFDFLKAYSNKIKRFRLSIFSHDNHSKSITSITEGYDLSNYSFSSEYLTIQAESLNFEVMKMLFTIFSSIKTLDLQTNRS